MAWIRNVSRLSIICRTWSHTSMSSSSSCAPFSHIDPRVDPRFDSLPTCGVVTVNEYSGQRAGGPYFDDLYIGQVFDWAPSATLSAGLAAAHQSILGDRLRLALDAGLSAAVTGTPGPLAHPGLVCDVAIGQST